MTALDQRTAVSALAEALAQGLRRVVGLSVGVAVGAWVGLRLAEAESALPSGAGAGAEAGRGAGPEDATGNAAGNAAEAGSGAARPGARIVRRVELEYGRGAEGFLDEHLNALKEDLQHNLRFPVWVQTRIEEPLVDQMLFPALRKKLISSPDAPILVDMASARIIGFQSPSDEALHIRVCVMARADDGNSYVPLPLDILRPVA